LQFNDNHANPNIDCVMVGFHGSVFKMPSMRVAGDAGSVR